VPTPADHNEPYRVLDEFVCQAIPEPSLEQAGKPGSAEPRGKRHGATPREETASNLSGHPILASLLTEAPRLRRDLPGWTASHLVPALAPFRANATGAQIATALAEVRKVLRGRADVDPWLGRIADLDAGQYAGEAMAMTPAAELNPRIKLPDDRIRNRTIVEQAQHLVRALSAEAPKQKRSPPRQSKPETN
jgi:hypothetical protein